MKKTARSKYIEYQKDRGEYHARITISYRQFVELKAVLQDRLDAYMEKQLDKELYKLQYGDKSE